MARPLRIQYEGAFYHVTERGNERGKISFSKFVNLSDADHSISAKIFSFQGLTPIFHKECLSELQKEALFVYLRSPLDASVLLHKSKSGLLVEMPCRVQTLECPKEDALIATLSTKVYRGADKPIADASSAQGIGRDEPPQMGALTFNVQAVDCDGPLDASRQGSGPVGIPPFVISPEELCQFGGYLCLEELSEPPMPVVVGPMKFNHPANRTGKIVLHNLDVRHI